MSRSFTVEKNPYNEPKVLFKSKEVTFNPGVTVLIGCNGSGKSTLLHGIEWQLKKIPEVVVVSYDNQIDGDQSSIGKHMFFGDTTWGVTAICSSEGERIYMNVGDIARKCGAAKRKFNSETKEFWLLMDAVDSGYSIDNVIDLKNELFNLIIGDMSSQVEVYIVVTANAYELVNGEQCLDVRTGKYVNFKDYNEYRDFILLSRANKDKRVAQDNKKEVGNR